jgi:hypothetical protein
MKKRLILLLIAATGLFSANAQQPRNMNVNKGTPVGERRPLTKTEIAATLAAFGVHPGAATTVPISCDVEDPQGNITTTVHVAKYPPTALDPAAPAYWLRYQSGLTMTKTLQFFVVPLSKGGPLTAQVQVFAPNSTADVVAPFAIPFWEGNLTNGNWALVVKNDLNQTAFFVFTVTN